MPSSDVDELTSKLQALELQQQHKLDTLLLKHRSQKKALINPCAKSPSPKQHRQLPNKSHQILSHSKFPLHKGDKVLLRSTASVGYKGDLAIVTQVAPKRIDIYVPRLDNKSWRIPQNLTHYSSEYSAETR